MIAPGKALPKRGEAVTVVHAWYGVPYLLSGPVKFIDEVRIEVGRTSIPWKGYGEEVSPNRYADLRWRERK